MKKTIAFFLVITLILNLLGFYVVFFLQQQGLQLQAANFREGEQRSATMTFNKQEFEQLNWTREGKEFKLNGNLYDVVSAETDGNRVYLKVVSDNSESDLIDGFTALFGKQTGSQETGGPVKTFLQHILLEYTLFTANFALFPDNQIAGSDSFQNDNFLSSSFSGLLSPPPQLT